MKRWILGIGLVVVVNASAEAGVGDAVKNVFSYAVSPVNCVLNLGAALVREGVTFVTCVLSNVNRNPATLQPVITSPITVPHAS